MLIYRMAIIEVRVFEGFYKLIYLEYLKTLYLYFLEYAKMGFTINIISFKFH